MPLAQRAAYRRVLAVLKARRLPFLVVGAMGLSLHLGRLVDGDLEIVVRDHEAALAALEAAGFKVDRDEAAPRAAVTYGQHIVHVAWGLPAPLGGVFDEAWYAHSSRMTFVDLRVRVAPLEEMLWMRIAADGDEAVGDTVIEDLLVHHGAELDWQRFEARLVGLEGLLLAHLFLLLHRHPTAGRAVVPTWVLSTLLARLNAGSESSVEPPPGIF